ncbi:MAG: co-chaperone GroES [Rickettsiaceae bacterium]|nr:co-chaperone GroES [Rickettsiaceae bacterium]
MNFRPLHDRVAIEPMASEEKTSGGIIIPDSAQEKSMQGKILAVGSGIRDNNGNAIPMQVAVGDIVMYGKWGGTEIKVDGRDLVIMKESDIIGVLSK